MVIMDQLETRMKLGVGMGTTVLLGVGGHQKHLSVANLRQRTINP